MTEKTNSEAINEGESFNAEAWLAEFETVGGNCWFSSFDGELKTGWQIAGRSNEDHLRAREFYKDIDDSPDREARIELIKRELRRKSAPDLSEAEPIDDLVARLRPMRNAFAFQFVQACEASGIDLNVRYDGDGERLWFGVACDGQEKERCERRDALIAVLKRSPQRRTAVIDLLNMFGRFVDDRPFGSLEDAANEFLAAGGRIYVLPEGICEETLALTEQKIEAEHWNRHKLRRLQHRYRATLRKFGGRNQLSELVKKNGKREGASEAIVWRGRK